MCAIDERGPPPKGKSARRGALDLSHISKAVGERKIKRPRRAAQSRALRIARNWLDPRGGNDRRR
jgi:hypothetical protein